MRRRSAPTPGCHFTFFPSPARLLPQSEHFADQSATEAIVRPIGLQTHGVFRVMFATKSAIHAAYCVFGCKPFGNLAYFSRLPLRLVSVTCPSAIREVPQVYGRRSARRGGPSQAPRSRGRVPPAARHASTGGVATLPAPPSAAALLRRHSAPTPGCHFA